MVVAARTIWHAELDTVHALIKQRLANSNGELDTATSG
jgi:hypothetical protein